uniref:hypothetical protein n=1 Tax=Lachnoclostridium phocaeense TaxID=1871021 RepID=UPI0026DB8942|nr:hypothetical protein [Lachnoclostridium phocaeense]
MKQEELSVNTPHGILKATVMPDEEYPGILTELIGPDGSPGVSVEYNPEEDAIIVRVFGKDDPDGDPVFITHIN